MQDLIEELKILVCDYSTAYSTSLKSLNSLNNSGVLPSYMLPGYSFKIGNVSIKNPVIAAPLAGISDNTYRIFAHYFGSALTCSEMISSYGIHFNHTASKELAHVTDFERPVALQIFGAEPDILLDAAQKIESIADIVDINMGCPVPKVLKSKSGGFLLQDEDKVEKIITKIAGGIKKPLTVKLRTGWDKNNINVFNIARIAQSSGAAAISIHGRTVKQGFSGEVNYDVIKKVKELIDTPVIASGDIESPAKARQALDYTGCDAVMIGRASKGAAWIFFNVLMSLKNELNADDFIPDIDFRKKFAELYLKFLICFISEEKAVKEFRKYLSWIFKGTKGINRFKHKFFSVKSFKDVSNIMSSL
ncbi:MAG: tRNA dihydrouridine synthase DusB [Actinobacteria bacterium]|nr:tRNA dihydrouridine synthase DusB [Actinomycetota bacterium]